MAGSILNQSAPIGSGYGTSNTIYNTSTNVAYVINNSASQVNVVNMTTQAVVANITVGTSPNMGVVNASTNTIYIYNSTPHTISVINGANNTVTTTVTVPAAIQGNPYLVGNNGYILMFSNSSSTVVYIMNLSNNTISTVTLPSAFYSAYGYYASTSSYLYINNSSQNTVFAINLSTSAITSITVTASVAVYPNCLNATTGYLYLPCSSSTTINIINTSNNTNATITTSAPVTTQYNGSNLLVDPVGNKVYIWGTGSSYSQYLTILSGTSYWTYYTVVSSTTNSPSQPYFYLSPSNYLYLSYIDSGGEHTGVWNANNSTFTFSVQTGTQVTNYVANTTTGMVYGWASGNGTIYAFSGTSLTGTISVSPYVNYLFVNQTTNTLYSFGSSTLTIIDGLTRIPVGSITLPAYAYYLEQPSNNAINTLINGSMYVLTFAQQTSVTYGQSMCVATSGGNKIQSGSSQTNVSYVATITFPVPYTSTPNISVTPWTNGYTIDITAKSTTSFSVISSNTYVSFDWISVGG